ncbi:hypothetical protein Pst134EA_024264 [Puccinia striiformis f. sp. tritici]|uniref:hypothetical protein n=1 Tax=Puccinia striiformis f. sp. tritici TaxID=168172 RepID=UPI00200837E2|nr:hypothetical protein Pst134EA_024264 [Puccinia striiformis f. sp. tritici]KAH9453388.1 hypothetical protein Pst134EA_024264 [Puccinia striiformis f. sp. tritici]
MRFGRYHHLVVYMSTCAGSGVHHLANDYGLYTFPNCYLTSTALIALLGTGMLQRGTIVLLATLIAALCFVDVSSGAIIQLWGRSTENNPHGLQDKPPSVPFDPKIWAKTHHNPSVGKTSQACADEHAGTVADPTKSKHQAKPTSPPFDADAWAKTHHNFSGGKRPQAGANAHVKAVVGPTKPKAEAHIPFHIEPGKCGTQGQAHSTITKTSRGSDRL